MKKSLVLAAVLAVFAVATAVAQPRAVGVRAGTGVAVNYQHNMGNGFLDVDAGLPMLVDGFGVSGTVTYNWVDPFGATVPWQYQGNWNWYLGVGAKGGMYGLLAQDITNTWFVGVAGRVGIEYNFWFPLNLSLDWTPNIGVVSGDKMGFNMNGLYDGISLGIRYKF